MTAESILTGMNLLLAVAIYGIVEVLKGQFMFASAATQRVFARVLPTLPLVLGLLGGVLGVVEVEPSTMASRVVAGLAVGAAAAVAFKIWKTTVRGHGLDPVRED